ncbi:NADPH-dependent FMN reductase [Massilia sp. erpn]|uniref:NADPH-dependent FMN reductase n=1 Tax=Massilia sp. erpn TaxID=2738142 RepID=UPI002102B2E3|nr:NAD(P)H-dependent oxidoreductase [Massilia sp. erpn]UTY57544.1 NAD(P)H-dependent oxidoreductase [Massilia sp. erpn]
MADKKIAVLVGSLRKESLNRKFAQELIAQAPAGLQLEIVEIGDLGLFNQDLDETGPLPAVWTAFRTKLKASDAILIVTPEYNRSVPGVLKNAIDIASRPYGHSIWDGKPVAVMSVSPGAIGGFGANHHVRQSMVSMNAPVMPAPEAYIGNAASLLGEDGKVNNDRTKELLQKFITAFSAWADTNAPKNA